MDQIRKLKRQRNWLLLAAFPILPFTLARMLILRRRKQRLERAAQAAFALYHRRDPAEIMQWLESFRQDLSDRLASGGLHDMAEAARKIEPLIPAYEPSIPMLVHPFTGTVFLNMMNGILDLQEAVGRRRFDAVVVTSTAADRADVQALIDRAGAEGDAVLVIDTSRDGALMLKGEVLKIYAVSPHMGQLADPEAERVLFEFIRSVHPGRVIVADSAMIWGAMSLYGKALAASAELSALFSARPDNVFTQRQFYRFFEMLAKIHVLDGAAREQLIARFSLSPECARRIAPLDDPSDATASFGPEIPPAIGGIGDTSCEEQTEFDISLIMTVHNETVVTGVTMIAANASVKAAERAGYSVEKVIVLDAATPRARACLSNPAYSDWKLVELTERDLGRARNRVVRMARGSYIAFLDADDLFSENWLAEGAALLDEAAKAGERVIAHPEINWIFDADQALMAVTPQESPIFSPVLFYFENYYDSLCMAPRQAHLDFPYVSRDIPNGLSYQDSQFAIETLAAGWVHRVAHDTIIFKRRRDTSLVTESHNRKSVIRQIEPLAIDNLPGLIAGQRAGAAGPQSSGPRS
ncbi:glycosyltransferase [Roseovarius sp. EGI FJ00037]|uniref:glycosyltransferase family 2 protein n=1 Tax=Roseovarius salincola TaxID=2978479 RepID=UPI0022A81A01|nr:glycosyltransferase [Roseovarius sp. EGI FJ00037]MCZ0814011.1 glycosyltransferase [Roseovarius sp. EGI FJ00037]